MILLLLHWCNGEVRCDMFLKILSPTLIILCSGDEATLTIITVSPGASSPPCITQTILSRVDTKGRLERPHGLKICTHTVSKTGEHGVTTGDVDILWR